MIEQINKNLHHSRNDEKLNTRRSPMNRASHFLRFVQETNIDIYVNLDAPPEISPERTASGPKGWWFRGGKKFFPVFPSYLLLFLHENIQEKKWGLCTNGPSILGSLSPFTFF